MKMNIRMGLLGFLLVSVSVLPGQGDCASKGRLLTIEQVIAPLRGLKVVRLDQLPMVRLATIYEASLGNREEAISACNAALEQFPTSRSFLTLRSSLTTIAPDKDVDKMIAGLGSRKARTVRLLLAAVDDSAGVSGPSSHLINESGGDTTDVHAWFDMGLVYQMVGKSALAHEAFIRSTELSNLTPVR